MVSHILTQELIDRITEAALEGEGAIDEDVVTELRDILEEEIRGILKKDIVSEAGAKTLEHTLLKPMKDAEREFDTNNRRVRIVKGKYRGRHGYATRVTPVPKEGMALSSF